MRSLTISSAGTFPSVAQGSTHIQPISSTFAYRPAPLVSHNNAMSPPELRSSTVSLATQLSFFRIDNNDSHSLPDQVVDQVNKAIQNGWSKSTINCYSGSIRQFILFCDSLHIPQSLRFPANEFILCTFAASSSGKHSGSTPRARLSALKAWHIAHNLKWKGSICLCYVLNGVRNLAPKSLK
jgi:hypothetical protein